MRVKAAVLKNVDQLCCGIYLSKSLSALPFRYLIVIKMMSDIVNVSVNSSRHLAKCREANMCPGLRVSSKEGSIGRKMGALAAGQLQEVSLKNLPIGKGSASVTQPPADHPRVGGRAWVSLEDLSLQVLPEDLSWCPQATPTTDHCIPGGDFP